MFAFFATITFVVWLAYELKKYDRLNKKAYEDFWENERSANEVRKKSLDNLSYITVPLEILSDNFMPEDETVSECLQILQGLSEKKIVNLTGLTNTELKMEYGVSNLTVLTEYDENYTLYARTMNKLAHIYYKSGYEDIARQILEKCIESKTDIKATYVLLAQIYQAHNETAKIAELIVTADELRSASKNTIKRALSEYVHID